MDSAFGICAAGYFQSWYFSIGYLPHHRMHRCGDILRTLCRSISVYKSVWWKTHRASPFGGVYKYHSVKILLSKLMKNYLRKLTFYSIKWHLELGTLFFQNAGSFQFTMGVNKNTAFQAGYYKFKVWLLNSIWTMNLNRKYFCIFYPMISIMHSITPIFQVYIRIV